MPDKGADAAGEELGGRTSCRSPGTLHFATKATTGTVVALNCWPPRRWGTSGAQKNWGPYHSYLNRTGSVVQPVKDRTRALVGSVHLIGPISNQTGIKPVNRWSFYRNRYKTNQ
jgi:hypothetical protein